ncbi:hypothetical protein RND81_05G092100 [Saponaria officinalis]|uniref:WRKY domain-containing protein n=1 Tax=Saponaria officinalis TaxID=3572 RepID=A0AAW1KZ28_SAPOF
MFELDMEDSWSLMAVVNECARKVKLRGVDHGGGGGGGLNTATQTATMVDIDKCATNSFCGQFDASNVSSFQNYPFSSQFDASSCNSLQNPLFSDQTDSITHINSVENRSFFSHQFDVRNDNSLQNPLFSSQTDSITYTNSVENSSLFSLHFDARNGNSLQNQLFYSQTNSTTHINSVENPSLYSNSLQNPLFSGPTDSTTCTNYIENSSLFSHEFDARNNSLQSPLFSGPTDSTTYTNSIENPSLFSHQFDAKTSNSLHNSLVSDQTDSTTHTNSFENPPFSSNSMKNSRTESTTHINSSENPPFPTQPDPTNNNFMKNPSLFPEKFGANTRNCSGCDHHFMNLYKHFKIPPSINQNSAEIGPLQDFKEVKDDVVVPEAVRIGVEQLKPPVNYLFLPKRNSQNNDPVSCDVDDHCTLRRRKFENRIVCKLSVDELGKNDKWAWRKYGQKPIKGSPYPRNYYKCSSMKSCMARKHVERSATDSETYVVTYTGQHHHPRPTYKNNGGHRSKVSRSGRPDPALGTGSPTSTIMATHLSVGPSRSGSGENVVILDGDEDVGGADSAGAAVGAGDSEEAGSNDKILSSNSMDINSAGGYEYEYEYGYGYGYKINKCVADVNTGVQEKGTIGDYGIWDSDMTQTNPFLF